MPRERLNVLTDGFDRAITSDRLAEAQVIVERLAVGLDDPVASAIVLRMRGQLAAAKGDAAAAGDLLAKAVAEARVAGRIDLLAAGWLADLGNARQKAGDLAGARVVLEEGVEIADRVRGADWATVRVMRLLGGVLTAQGDPAKAAEVLGRAVASAAGSRPGSRCPP